MTSVGSRGRPTQEISTDLPFFNRSVERAYEDPLGSNKPGLSKAFVGIEA